MNPDFDIRYTALEDLSVLQNWFVEEPQLFDAFPFNQKEQEEALKNWIGFSRFKASLTGMIGKEICAIGTLFLMPYRKVAHQCSFFLVVGKGWRRQGIGASMVKNLMNLAKTRFRLESIYVELYEPSVFIPLLLRQGYQEIVRQENFVKIDGKPHARLILEHPL